MIAEYLYWLDQIQPLNRNTVGDKAFYLGTVAQRGCPVIPGFVITAPVFREFLDTINWQDPLFTDLPNSSLHLNVNNFRQLQAIAQQLRHAIQSTPLPVDWLTEIVARTQTWQVPALMLRPSFTVGSSLDPTLSSRTKGLLSAHVCWSTEAAIAYQLKQVWGELYRAKSLLYWHRSNIPLQQINLAVLVQPIWGAIASGELRVDPASCEIRANWGLGWALVNGEVIPDVYDLQIPTGRVRSQHLGSKEIAYQVVAPPPSSGLATAIATSSVSECLQFFMVDPTEQQRFVLTEAHLQTFTDLAQQVTTDLNTPTLMAEWLLCEASQAMYLTQITPYLLSGGIEPPPILTTPASTPVSGVTASSLIASGLTGLAASRGQAIARVQVLKEHNVVPDTVLAGMIVVASLISPDQVLTLRHVAGIVTERGSMTSHGAIVARELGIPAIVGVENATQLLKNGEVILLDGDRGMIHRIEHESLLAESIAQATAVQENAAPESRATPAVVPPTATRLMVNLSQVESLPQITHLPLDGVGLLRSELMMPALLEQQQTEQWLQSGRQKDLVDRIANQIRPFVEAFNPRPVFYRSLDWRSHELGQSSSTTSAVESILGLHGTLSYQLDSRLFQVELAALRQVQQWGFSNIHLLLPFVRTVEEFIFCRQLAIAAELTQTPQFQLWIMAEVPSALFLISDYVAAGAQGIAIGTNDLLQLLLAADRDQSQIAALYDQRHPVLLRAIQQLVQAARQSGVPCSICGQAPSQYPELIETFVRWGATSISVDLAAVASTHTAIARAERQLILEAVRHAR